MEPINLTEYLQRAKFRAFHLRLAAAGFLLIMFDGYDVAVSGAITPSLMDEWNMPAAEAGAIGSASLVGMLFGAITFGALADRIGRRRVLLATAVVYSVFTALGGFADGPTFFLVCRLLAGLGLGGVMPNVIALLTDFMPKRHTSTVIMGVLCGFAVGGLLSPLLGIALLPTAGWQVSLWIAALPLLFLRQIHRAVPRSPAELVARHEPEAITRFLARHITPDNPPAPGTTYIADGGRPARIPLVDLFQERRGTSTLLFWIALFAHLLLAYGTMNWLPKLMMDRGFSLRSSLVFSVVWQIGGIVGTVVAGTLADKTGTKKTVAAIFFVDTVLIAVIGVTTNPLLAYCLIGVAGATVTGVQNLVQVYISQYYPPFVRSTALGSASGIGRLGGIIGPVLGGILLSLSLGTRTIFLVFALPGLVSTLAVLFVKDRRSYQHDVRAARTAGAPATADTIKEVSQ